MIFSEPKSILAPEAAPIPAEELEKMKVEEIPDNLIEEEIKVLSQGMSEEDAKKSRKNFEEVAKKRIKVGLVLNEFGEKNQGKTLHFSTTAGPDKNLSQWIEGQKKTKLNQQPLFDVFDKNGISYSDDSIYSSTNFAGSELFSYKISAGAITDTVLGLQVKYNTINNVGDLVFDVVGLIVPQYWHFSFTTFPLWFP